MLLPSSSSTMLASPAASAPLTVTGRQHAPGDAVQATYGFGHIMAPQRLAPHTRACRGRLLVLEQHHMLILFTPATC